MLGRAAVVVAAAGLFAGMIGCDARPRRVPVAGKVLIDGKPLTTGFIMVVPHEGRAATGAVSCPFSARTCSADRPRSVIEPACAAPAIASSATAERFWRMPM